MVQGELSQCVYYSTHDCRYYRVGHDLSIRRGTEGKLKTTSLNCGSDCGIGCVVDKFDDCRGGMSIGLIKPRKLKSVDMNRTTSA